MQLQSMASPAIARTVAVFDGKVTISEYDNVNSEKMSIIAAAVVIAAILILVVFASVPNLKHRIQHSLYMFNIIQQYHLSSALLWNFFAVTGVSTQFLRMFSQ